MANEPFDYLLEWNNWVCNDKWSSFSWPSHWPLGDLTIIVLDDSEWPEVHDPKWETAKGEYENEAVIDFLSEGGGEILQVSDNEGIEKQVNKDGESTAIDTPSTKIENAWKRDTTAQPIACALKTINS